MNKFSVFIPTYNAAQRIEKCLISIRQQEYPADKVEIVVVDGGSTDGTRAIAGEFGATVLDNPKKLAHFAFSEFAAQATGDLVIMFAADNELGVPNWLSMANTAFERYRDMSALWGRQVAAPQDPPANHYYELIQNDPLSFFVNRNLDFYKRYGSIFEVEGSTGWLFRVEAGRPLVWGANGLVLRWELAKPFFLKSFAGDNDVFQGVIESGHNLVGYLPGMKIIHHHIRSVAEWAGKLKRNFHRHFLSHYEERNMGWILDKTFRRRLLLWIIYAGVPFFSGFDAVVRSVRDRNACWLYHPVFNMVQLTVYSWLMLSTREGRSYLKKSLLRTFGP